MATKSCVASSAFTPKTQTIRTPASAGSPKQTWRRANQQCAANADAEAVAAQTDDISDILQGDFQGKRVFGLADNKVVSNSLFIEFIGINFFAFPSKDIIFIFQSIMAQTRISLLHRRFNRLLSSLAQLSASEVEECEGYGLALLDCNQSFHGRFTRLFLTLKKRVIDFCLASNVELSVHSQKTQSPELKKVQAILGPLMETAEHFLEQGIFTLQMDLSSLKNNQDESEPFIQLIDQITQQLLPLLNFYFAYRQYKRRKQNPTDRVLHSSSRISSLKEVPSSEPTQDILDDAFDQGLITSIERQLEQFTITQLFDSHLKEEEERICESIQICRVCGSSVKLNKLEQHIKQCSKRAQAQFDLEQLEEEKRKLYSEVRIVKRNLLQKDFNEMSDEDTLLLKIISKIAEQKSGKKMVRRSSENISVSKLNSFSIEDEINQFQEQYGQSDLLGRLLDNQQKLASLKQKIEQLASVEENNSVMEEKFQIQSLEESLSNVFINTNGFKTKKSIFASKDKSQTSSQSLDSNSDTKKDGDSSSRSHIRESRKLKSEKLDRQEAEKSKTSIKLLKSLKKISSLEKQEAEELSFTEEKAWRSMKFMKYEQYEVKKEMTLSDFEVLKFLGKGAFGEVYLVRRKKTGDLYALKQVKIDQSEGTEKLELIKNEHQIFKNIAGDHLIRAPFAFSQNGYHFFILDFMSGGDFSQLLAEEVYLEQEKAKFYLAEVILALEHLHRCGIIHRDLKPENLVLDQDGHLKLTDFGLSEIKIRKKIRNAVKITPEMAPQLTKSGSRPNRRAALINKVNNAKIIGTPDYIAPEIINQTSINNSSIDWWSLGVIAYEMMVGCRPFAADTIEEVLDNIIEGRMEWPQIGTQDDMISPEAADLIKRLLDKNFQSRLGSENVEDIKKHPFFSGVDWQNVKHQTPPIVPPAANLKELEELAEDIKLRREIWPTEQQKIPRKKSLKLDNFVRYDLLLEQTFESAGKKINKGKNKMKKLKSLVVQFKQNQSQRPHSRNSHRDSGKMMTVAVPATKKKEGTKQRRSVCFKGIDLRECMNYEQ